MTSPILAARTIIAAKWTFRFELAMTGLSLFSGIGGLDLAAEMAGIQTVAMCEKDPFCRRVLCKHWPDVPIYEDVFELRGEDVGPVDVIHGGFPCQPFSVAGRQRGQKDERYLWPEFSRLVEEIGPRWVVAENVPGILTLAADDVCKDLERLDYSVGIWHFEAAAVRAPHRRARVFFVGYSDCQGLSIAQRCRENAERTGGGATCRASWWSAEPDVGRGLDGLYPWLDGNWERGIPRTAVGVKDRVNRLRALGNAVVPQQAYPIFAAIAETEKQNRGVNH